MQFAILICVCILILAATTALDAPCERMNVTPFGAAFLALFLIALSRFTFAPCPEFRINAAAALLPAFLLTGTIFKRERILERSSVLLLLSSALYCAAAELFSSSNTEFLLFALVALVAAFLRESPLFSMFVASLVPLVGLLFCACYELILHGYASCDLAAAYVLDAQTAGLLSTSLALYLFGAQRTRIERT